MKNYFFAIGCMIFWSVSGQDVSKGEDYKMVVHTQCEKQVDNTELLNCFQNVLIGRFTKKLEQYMDRFEYFQMENSDAKIDFIVNRNGQLKLNSINSTNGIYRAYVERAFLEVMDEINSDHDEPLQPAIKISTQEAIGIGLSFPVSFKMNPNFYASDHNDRVVAHLGDANFSFEIILTAKNELRVYEVRDETMVVFLGKFTALTELSGVEPYKTIIEKHAGDYIFVAEGVINDRVYQVRTNNLLIDSGAPFYIQIVEKRVDKRKVFKEVALFSSFMAFKLSKYFGLVKRNY